MRIGIPKFTRIWAVSAALAFSVPYIQKHLPERYAAWSPYLFALFLILAMVFLVAGMVAERREAENHRKEQEEALLKKFIEPEPSGDGSTRA